MAPVATQFFFYLFAAIMVVGGIMVITRKNPVHSALSLVLCFFTSAVLWLLIEAEFLAIVLVLVYVGAVMVLFLFVVMMLDINPDRLREGFWAHLPFAAAVGVLIVLEMALVLVRTFLSPEGNAPPIPPGTSNTRELGRLIFTHYVFAFEVAATILLLAIVAAVALTLRQRKDTRGQVPSQQVAVRAADRVRIVSMPSETKE